MSRAARFAAYTDENAAGVLHGHKPTGLKPSSLTLTKPATTTTATTAATAHLRPRAALGDISNRNAAQQQLHGGADKEGAVGAGLVKKPLASRIPTVAARLHTAQLAALVKTALPASAATSAAAEPAEGPVAMDTDDADAPTTATAAAAATAAMRRTHMSDLASPDLKRSTSCRAVSAAQLGGAVPDMLAVDAAYAGNAQYNVRLLPSILAHLHASELKKQPSPSYMLRQADLTARMREILIDWLVEVHVKFRLQTETLYLCVYIIDKFLERRAVMKNKLQLVGCTALLLAAKYEEIYAPEVMDFVHIADKTYSKEQILQMESIMLTALQFNITTASAYRFLQRYHMLATTTMCGGADNARLRATAEYLLELTLQEYRFLQYLPSRVAASACYIALATVLGRRPCGALCQYTGYALEGSGGVGGCVAEVMAVVGGGSKYRAVRKKYADVKFDEASNFAMVSPFELCGEE